MIRYEIPSFKADANQTATIFHSRWRLIMVLSTRAYAPTKVLINQHPTEILYIFASQGQTIADKHLRSHHHRR